MNTHNLHFYDGGVRTGYSHSWGVIPHNGPSIDQQSTQQNQEQVEFLDKNAGETLVVSPSDDLLSSTLEGNDFSMGEFLSRPLRIAKFSWPQGPSRLWQTVDPWQAFLSNKQVSNRLNNFRLLRGNLHVKILINGNPFFFGFAMVNYNPLPTLDDLTRQRSFADVDSMSASQRPHVFLDPSNDKGAEMVFPFFLPTPFTSLFSDGSNILGTNLGVLQFVDLSPLQHANDSNENLDITVIAWMTDVSYGGMTGYNNDLVTPQSDEYGIISGPADVVKKISSSMVKAPYIGKYAMATQHLASAVSSVARMFGFSRPIQIETSQATVKGKSSYANYNVSDNAVKLSMDVKQELTIDPSISGYSNGDELSIQSIASRETWIGKAQWTRVMRPDDRIVELLVGPQHTGVYAAGGDNEYHLSAIAFPSMFFDQWRGTIRYRFVVACSGFHKGRLMVVYDPSGSPANSESFPNINTQKVAIIDLASTRDFCVDVGWGQQAAFCNLRKWDEPVEQIYGSQTCPWIARENDYFNGVLGLYVVNELTTPNTTINNDISIHMFVSAGEDFQLASPRTDIGNPTFFNKSTVTPQADLQSESIDSACANVVLRTGASPTASGDLNKIYFGENIVSLRQLLKRYMFHENFFSTQSGGNTTYSTARCIRQALPYEPGYTSSKAAFSTGVLNTEVDGADTYAVATSAMTHIRLISSAYAGWRGAIRYTLQPITAIGNFTMVNVERAPRPRVYLSGEGLFPQQIEPGDGMADTYTSYPTDFWFNSLANKQFFQTLDGDNLSGLGGREISNKSTEIINVEIPYQSPYLFSPARRRTRFEGDQFQNYFTVQWSLLSTSGIIHGNRLQSYVAVGEDFTTYMFLGCPILYSG